MTDATATWGPPVATLSEDARVAFLMKVYQHLALAVAAFMGFSVVLSVTGIAEAMWNFVAGRGMAWLLILGAFMIVQMMATTLAVDPLNPGKQYGGLFLMAGAEALIFAPFLYYVFNTDGAGTVGAAAALTLIGFAGLSVVALITRKDLSFLRPLILWGGVAALLLIVGAVLFGANLGTWFSVAMIGLAGGAILYSTQTIYRRYPEEAYVAGALQLFASVMTLFWYVLRLVAARD